MHRPAAPVAEAFIRTPEQQALQQDLTRMQRQLEFINTQDVSVMTVAQKRTHLIQKYALLKQILKNMLAQINLVEIRSLPEPFMTSAQRVAKRKELSRLKWIPINNEIFFVEDELARLGVPGAMAMDHGRAAPAPVGVAVPAPAPAPAVAPAPAPRVALFGFLRDWWSGSKRK